MSHTTTVPSQKGRLALVTGILGIVCCGPVAGIPAIILGSMANKKIDAAGVVGLGTFNLDVGTSP